MSDPARLPHKMEQRLERYYASRPRPGFEHSLEQRLMEAAKTMQPTQTPRPANRFGRVFQWSLSLAGLALIVIVMTLALQTRPQPAAVPSAAPATDAAVLPPALTPPAAEPESIPQNTMTATPLPAGLEAPRRLLPGLCPAAPAGTESAPENPPLMPRSPQGELGGGEVAAEAFTIHLRLVCDPGFTNQSPEPNMATEVEGLGIASSWDYQGASVVGETIESAGFQPYVTITGSVGPSLDSGTGNTGLHGMQFPAHLFMSFPPGDLTFSYLLTLRAPDGRLVGAELRFTLHPEPDGYRPVNISVRPLDPAALAAPTPAAPEGFTPLATLPPDQVDPALGRLAALIGAWEDRMLNQPGWVYWSQHVESRLSGGFQPNGREIPAETTDEMWYLLDQDGYVQRSIYRQLDMQGQLVQASVMTDGEYRNLLDGDVNRAGTPWRPDLSFNFYNEAAEAVRRGVAIIEKPDEVNGRAAVQFVLDYSGYSISVAIDAASGQALVYERLTSPGIGQPAELEQRLTTLITERRDAPPPEILALLQATPAAYRPALPLGTPAPQGFDPSSSYLGFKIINGDSISQPTFFHADIYALPRAPSPDGTIQSAADIGQAYLLGRVDFGSIPGGWCDRSGDGKRLAFSWLQPGDETHIDHRLRWFELTAPGLVYMPDPELNLNSPVAFAPTGYMVAFFGCKGQACGLYTLETEGDTVPARLLTPDLANSSVPIWKPDGTQIASVTLDDQGALVMTIVDAQTGAIVYQGPRFGSPFESWGTPLPDSLTGFGRCIAP